MKHAVFCALALAIFAIAGRARADTAVIALRWTADLPGTHYTLGDIADIESTDAALKEKLAQIQVGAVPRQGYVESVTRNEVEALVRQQVSLQSVEWRGAQTIRIRGRGQHVMADRLLDTAAYALYGVLVKDFKAIEMQPVSAFEGINVPAGDLRLVGRVPPAQQVARRMSALVDVTIDGQVYTTVPVWFSVHASKPALRARTVLKKGSALRADDFQMQMVDVAAQGGKALASDAPLDALRLKRELEPGAVLSATQVEMKPSVARDQHVTVRVVTGAVTIETSGRALADARIGDVVKVKNESSSEAYSARVIAEGLVLVNVR